MKKFLLGFSLLLFVSSALIAQPPSNSRSIPGSNARVNLEFQKNILQTSIGSLTQEYENAGRARKQQIQEELQGNLFSLFDIGILQKEAEVAELRKQIASVKENEAYKEDNREIAQLENSLQQVQSSLNFRKENREKIVAQRLKEILGN